MTYVFQSKEVNGHYIELVQEKFESSYKVKDYPMQGEGLCGYPDSQRYYDTLEKAQRRFNSLVRKYKGE